MTWPQNSPSFLPYSIGHTDQPGYAMGEEYTKAQVTGGTGRWIYTACPCRYVCGVVCVSACAYVCVCVCKRVPAHTCKLRTTCYVVKSQEPRAGVLRGVPLVPESAWRAISLLNPEYVDLWFCLHLAPLCQGVLFGSCLFEHFSPPCAAY